MRKLIQLLDGLPLEDLEEVSYLLWQAHDICERADPTVLSALPGSGRRRSRSTVVRLPQTATDSHGLWIAADPTVLARVRSQQRRPSQDPCKGSIGLADSHAWLA